ncbi:unnamed protein product [Paramecium octaurelia]|uniref:Uncharacterized protein n=1 Tax=Paramecium octaurelia TaxID=43137 RepID=A0A8S1USQ7_PAROT|nr:unnamed protein product [Paramecium octaurelia]
MKNRKLFNTKKSKESFFDIGGAAQVDNHVCKIRAIVIKTEGLQF